MQLNPLAVSIVIPAYNEEASISQVVKEIRDLYSEFEIVVVDDGSTDRTAEEARLAGARVIQHPYNIGNGAAVKTGIRHASGRIVVLMDGDGQHSAGEIPRLLEPMGTYDMVVGARSREEFLRMVLCNRNSRDRPVASGKCAFDSY